MNTPPRTNVIKIVTAGAREWTGKTWLLDNSTPQELRELRRELRRFDVEIGMRLSQGRAAARAVGRFLICVGGLTESSLDDKLTEDRSIDREDSNGTN